MSTFLWLLCTVGVGIAYLLTPSAAILSALILFFTAPVVSWLLLFAARSKIRIRIDGPAVTAKNKPFILSIDLADTGKLPIGKVIVHMQIINSVTDEVTRVCSTIRGKETWKLISEYCGCLECRITNARCYDYFGVFPMPVRISAKKRIVVMPDTFPVEVQTVLSVSDLEDCTEYSPNQKGWDRTETYQIRDYVPGDSLQQIHWKLSGKQDRLIVRDPALPVDRELMVFLDRTSMSLKPADADALMEAVTSVCQALAEAGQPFRLAWNEELVDIREIENKEQLPEAVSAMLKAHRLTEGPSGAELYQKTSGEKKEGAVLYFCSQLPGEVFPLARTRIFLCGQGDGENVTAFGPEDMEDKLRILGWS